MFHTNLSSLLVEPKSSPLVTVKYSASAIHLQVKRPALIQLASARFRSGINYLLEVVYSGGGLGTQLLLTQTPTTPPLWSAPLSTKHRLKLPTNVRANLQLVFKQPTSLKLQGLTISSSSQQTLYSQPLIFDVSDFLESRIQPISQDTYYFVQPRITKQVDYPVSNQTLEKLRHQLREGRCAP